MEFNFGHTKYIKFSLEKEHTQEWIVSLKGQEWVCVDMHTHSVFVIILYFLYSHVYYLFYLWDTYSHIYIPFPFWQVSEDHINKLDLEEGVYPPCKVFEVCWSSATPPKRSLKIEARIHNVEQSFCDQNYLSYKITASAGYCVIMCSTKYLNI